ncbi:MAG TPA: hypothetical protein VJO52_16865 [Gemmatimonadaceae bacterium]|nr:hypothetical protein [Gemmatimonadaceae bacterium]
MVAFEVGAGEESTVEKGNAAEGTCGSGACAGWCIECAEEKWEENFAVVLSAAFHAPSETILEESAIVVEPTFGLEKAEKEESRHVQQREVGSFGYHYASSGAKKFCGVGEVGDDLFECSIEPSCQGVAAECIEPGGMGEDVGFMGRGGESGKCLCITGDDVSAIDVEGDSAWCGSVGRPGRDDEVASIVLCGDEQPGKLGRMSGAVFGGCGGECSKRRRGIAFDEECAQSAGAAGDAGGAGERFC